MRSIKRFTALAMLMAYMLQFTQGVSADSLWTGTKMTEGSYFVDGATGSRCINDIIFIYISESTTANVTSDQNFDTQNDVQGGFKSWFNIEGWDTWSDIFKLESPQMKTKQNDPDNLPAWQFNVDNEFEAEAESARTSLVKTKIAARVIEIKPNGNLLIEGKRAVKINQELSQLLLTGVARPEDIDQDNMIESSKLADLKISVIGQGEVTRASSRGVIGRILDYLR